MQRFKLQLRNLSTITPIPQYTTKSLRTGLLAQKKGMTSLWDHFGKIIPVTVLKVSECQVIKTRFHSGCNSHMIQIGSVTNRKKHTVNRSLLFHYRKHQVQPKRKLVEFKISQDACIPSGKYLLTLPISIKSKNLMKLINLNLDKIKKN
jgi:large subunit ribosomal protein L3